MMQECPSAHLLHSDFQTLCQVCSPGGAVFPLPGGRVPAVPPCDVGTACHSLQGIGSPCPSPRALGSEPVSLPAVFPAGSGNPQLHPVPPSPHLAPPCWVVGHLSCDVDTSLLSDHVVCDVRERAAVSMLGPLNRLAALGCMTPHPGCMQ